MKRAQHATWKERIIGVQFLDDTSLQYILRRKFDFRQQFIFNACYDFREGQRYLSLQPDDSVVFRVYQYPHCKLLYVSHFFRFQVFELLSVGDFPFHLIFVIIVHFEIQ